jgi:serine/threonine protein kinase
MVLNVFGRKDQTLSDDGKQFIQSLPSTYINVFRKKRQLLPVWGSHKYCVMIKSTYMLYYRVTKPEELASASSSTSAAASSSAITAAAASSGGLKYLNLATASVRLLDDDATGYVFCVTPESGKGSIYFAADSEKDRAKFAQLAAAIQRQKPCIDDFETLKVLGKGHYGRVILARARADQQLYAVKEMKLNQVKAKVVYTERSVMEWVAEHPFIIGLDYAFARGKSVFLVSKFMPGGDLFLHMQNNGGCFNEDVVKFYGAELLLALEHMHNMSIMHRDIKPENVLLDTDGHIKLADMGLAKRLDSRAGRTKTMCGTDTYLPPEMVGRYPGGHGLPVDMWQFGCILFELRAGYPPFYIPQSSQKSTHQRILYQAVRYPNNISKDFKSLLVGLLEKKQEDRLGFQHGVAELKAHAFFKGVDWDKVLQKQIAPPLLPGPAGDNLVNNFDPQFTEQPHQIYIAEDVAGAGYERDFAGFDYVRPSLAVANVSSGEASSTPTSSAATTPRTESHPSSTSCSSGANESTKDDEKPEIEVEAICIKI